MFSPLLALFTILLLYFCYKQRQHRGYLSHLPWASAGDKTLVPRLRARIINMLSSQTAMDIAYQDYTLNKRSFVFPTMDDDMVVLPPDHLEWVVNQPDEVLSTDQFHVDIVLADLTHPSPNIVRNPIHKYIVSHDLTRNVANLIGDIYDEIQHTMGECWPKQQDQFQDVCVFPTMMKVIAGMSNRVFVGFPLCRNERIIDNAIGFVQEVAIWATALKQVPEIIRPWVAKVCLFKNRNHITNFNNVIIPEIKKRQAAMTDAEKAHASHPNDMIQWLIDRAENFGGVECDPYMIAGRLLSLNFAAIHTTAFSITNVIFDLLNSPPEDRWIEQLREEAATALTEANGVWTKQSLAKLHKIDSTLRESSRMSTILAYSMIRKVVVKDGVTSPNGTYLPFGVTVAIPTDQIHRHPDNYDDPNTYDPFRFYRQNTKVDTEDNKNVDNTKRVNLGFVSTSPIYHPWGHGKHGCPGRFFAANELKLLLAYLVLNYDFELMDQRPKSRVIGAVRVAPMTSSVRVRHRVDRC